MAYPCTRPEVIHDCSAPRLRLPVHLLALVGEVVAERATRADTRSCGCYAEMEPRVREFYGHQGADPQMGRPGVKGPDVEGTLATGRPLVAEIKSARESRSSASSWWSHWSLPPRSLGASYGSAVQRLSGRSRGWCAVVDGQLREYCNMAGAGRGDLIVEDGAQFRVDVVAALRFLAAEGRLSSWSRDSFRGLDIFTVRLAK